MSQKITIDPITRLEGHGKIAIFLDDTGNVEHAYFQIPELRGFEKFCEGRPCEDMPQITSRICGVCPTAHHMASTRALDDLYRVEPTPTAKKVRELVYNTFMLEDHALHFFFLGGPDFVTGPDAPKAERNVLGVIGKVGLEIGQKVISMRKQLRDLITEMGGKVIHPVLGLPGGVAKQMKEEVRQRFEQAARDGIEFALFSLKLFDDVVLSNSSYLNLITSEGYTHRTYYMGLVDDKNFVNFYSGWIRVVSPEGEEFGRFRVQDYLNQVSEHVEPWTYVKFPFLKQVGWNGFTDGKESGIYSVAPLARLNAAEGMATPKANEYYKRYFETLGGKPVHFTLANHWARLIEMLYAAERMLELAGDPEVAGKQIRAIPDATPKEGFGVVEAPRGTLIHHYQTDERGVIHKANLIVATQNNAGRIAMSVDKAARHVIRDGHIDDGILNKVEMAFRAYDPCHACATHAFPGEMPLIAEVFNSQGEIINIIRRR